MSTNHNPEPIPQTAAYYISRTLAGLQPDGVPLDSLPQEWRTIAERLEGSEQGQRRAVLQAELERAGISVVETIRTIFTLDPKGSPPAPTPRIRFTVAQLLDEPDEEPKWAAEGILPVGLTFFAGRPKIGKSWLMLQGAQSIALGAPLLGRKTAKTTVIYLALEDGKHRLKKRLRQQQARPLTPVHFVLSWPTGTQGLQKLAELVEAEKPGLVIIDTLSRLLGGRADQNDVGAMTEPLSILQGIALANDCAIIIVDHHKKVGFNDDDPIADILGSTAKGAVADCIWGLYRKRGERGATLRITGRDMDDQDIALEFDGVDTYSWQFKGDARQLAKDETESDILDAVHELGKADAGAVAKHLGKDRSWCQRLLKRLTDRGLLASEQQTTSKGAPKVVYYEK